MNLNPDEVGYIYTAIVKANTIALLGKESKSLNSKVKLYLGYRQLNKFEINKYTLDFPPPIPYPYQDQINNTVLYRTFVTTCLSTSNDDETNWNLNDCQVN